MQEGLNIISLRQPFAIHFGITSSKSIDKLKENFMLEQRFLYNPASIQRQVCFKMS